jgi:Domain of unknown function (DUF4345)
MAGFSRSTTMTTTDLLCVGLGVLFYTALGLAALTIPNRILLNVGITVVKRDSRNEIRAVYGGLPLAFASMLCVAIVMPHLANGILLTVSMATLGMAIGRLLSLLLDRGMGTIPTLFTAIELIVAVLIGAPLYMR